jgi:hypothetical protein
MAPKPKLTKSAVRNFIMAQSAAGSQLVPKLTGGVKSALIKAGTTKLAARAKSDAKMKATRRRFFVDCIDASGSEVVESAKNLESVPEHGRFSSTCFVNSKQKMDFGLDWTLGFSAIHGGK